MKLNNGDRYSNKDIRLLNDAFISFNEATQRLQRYYEYLEERVKALDLELKKKNRELKKSLREKGEVRNYLNNILESLSTGVIVVGLDKRITIFNKAARRISGLSLKRVKGKDFDSVFRPLLTEDSINFEFLKGVNEHLGIETTITAKDKNVLQVRLSSSPVRSQRGKIFGFVILVQDITKTKKLEEQVQRTGRLAAMGEIAVGIAHEIRNPLGTIELFASLLRKDLANDENGRKLAEFISSGVKNLDQIVCNMLLFTKHQKPVFREVDVIRYLDDSLRFASHIMKQNKIKLVKEFYSGHLMVQGDLELLKQVFLNIILNAVQSMKSGGSLTISIALTNEGLRPGAWKSDVQSPPIGLDNHGFVVMSFIDTGVGISDDDQEKIFNPFFTTKEKGTGLGLSIVHNILESHGGIIDVKSEMGKGSVFTITLPLSEDSRILNS